METGWQPAADYQSALTERVSVQTKRRKLDGLRRFQSCD
jgi:hypothetical protein